MLKQYSILSKCLCDLKKSDLPIIEKLRIEVQLIQTKRILLDHDVEHGITGLARSEREFNDLYVQLRQVCDTGGGTEIERLKALIQDIKDGLNFGAGGRDLYTLPQVSDKKHLGAVLKPLHSVKDIFR